MRVRELRLARGWSQAQLAERSGLSVRTIQRIEQGAHPGLESMTLLATALGVDVDALREAVPDTPVDMTMAEAVTHALRHYSDFRGVAGRPEFWWSTLALTLALAVGNAVGPWLSATVGVVALVPWLAVTTRRLRDAGQSPWWVLVILAPVGGLVALAALCAMPSTRAGSVADGTVPEAGRS